MLLTYDEALARILGAAVPVGRPAEVGSLQLHGPTRVLAVPLVASEDNPRFDNSAVDGYAFHAADLAEVGKPIPITFVAAAGSQAFPPLAPGSAARIFTGACLPDGAAGVAMQEDVRVVDGCVALTEELKPGHCIRRAGTDFHAGDLLVEGGTPITPGVAGLLASQGITKPHVMSLPRCIVITTGDEIVPPEREPGPGELRDSVGAVLTRAGEECAVMDTAFAPDDQGRLTEVLARAAQNADAVFVAGGASVGDRDFTARSLAELGIIDFHGIKLRPGKPLLFGHIKGKPVVGLPGNPASAFICFHLFGLPLLRRLGGWSDPANMWLKSAFGSTHSAEARDVFARVSLKEGSAVPVHEQGSFGLRSLAAAQALARLPAGTNLAEGDEVWVTLL